MGYTSATDQKFLSTLESWLRGLPEILVLIRYPASGSRDFQFFSSFEALSNRRRQLPPSTSIIAFRRRQLPLREVVDDRFIASCLGCIPDRAEFIVLETARRAYGRKSWFHSAGGETHRELREALEDSRGVLVAVGPYPPWLEDTDDVVSAIVPDENGIARVGIF
jgi:hypothetical protein